MRGTYTAVILPEDGGYYARVPDIKGCITSGKSLEDAIFMITDALHGCLLALEDLGLPIHPATDQNQVPHKDTDILVSIDVDTDAYREQETAIRG